MRKALFPGSFDPVTKGHENVVIRATSMFDEVVIAVGRHREKKGLFSVEERLAMLEATFASHPSVQVLAYEGLTASFCQSVGAGFQLRGVRNPEDEIRANVGSHDESHASKLGYCGASYRP